MSSKLSIKDIAQKCGTSITTVSFVINGRGAEKNISTAMIKKIEEFIAQVGYHPHSMAQGLRTGKSKTIAFLVDDISEPFFSGIAKHIDKKANEKGYKIVFCCTGNDRKKTSELLSMLASRSIDGYIIALAEGMEDEMATLLGQDIPVVIFDSYQPDKSNDYVLVDNMESTYRATAHLIESGYVKIAYICPHNHQPHMVDRCMGYVKAMNEHLLDEKVVYLRHPLEMDTTLADLLNGENRPDAFLFAANYITMHAIRVIMDLDQSFFGKIGMVSFDDFEILKYLPVPMTAIEQPLDEIAEAIMDIMLFKLGRTALLGDVQRVIKTKMKIRSSSMPISSITKIETQISGESSIR